MLDVGQDVAFGEGVTQQVAPHDFLLGCGVSPWTEGLPRGKRLT